MSNEIPPFVSPSENKKILRKNFVTPSSSRNCLPSRSAKKAPPCLTNTILRALTLSVNRSLPRPFLSCLHHPPDPPFFLLPHSYEIRHTVRLSVCPYPLLSLYLSQSTLTRVPPQIAADRRPAGRSRRRGRRGKRILSLTKKKQRRKIESLLTAEKASALRRSIP